MYFFLSRRGFHFIIIATQQELIRRRRHRLKSGLILNLACFFNFIFNFIFGVVMLYSILRN
jgi:hypothetical protein